MKRKIIVYFGIIQYEYSNAMCRYAEGIKKLIRINGYTPVCIGVSPNVKRHEYKIFSDDTYMLHEPQNIFARIMECISSSDIKRLLNKIGLSDIKAVIMADFRYFPMRSIKKYCEKNGINFVVNIMDRFQTDSRFISHIKRLDSEIRIKRFYPKVKRRIYICSPYNELIGTGEHTAVIPGVTWEYEKNAAVKNGIIELIFLGQPGKRCEKEKIDWVIRAVSIYPNIRLTLAGFDGDEFLANNAALKGYISDNVIFLGRVSHDRCPELLRNADFSLVIRPDTVLSRYGFSTKIGEAFSCGTPVISTKTSDNGRYIENGKNGFICGCSYRDVEETIDDVSKLGREEINRMKEDVIAHRVLDYRKFSEIFRKAVIES